MSDSSTPPAPFSNLSRRTALKGIAGAAGVAASGALLAACSSDDKSSGKTKDTGEATAPITFGSNYSDDATKAAFAALCTSATGSTKVPITVNTTDHNTFQNNISNYLQGTPDSLATWFAGYRLQFFAAQGLLAPIDDVWDKIGGDLQRRRQEPLQGPRRPLLHGSAVQLPVGRLLQQERLRREGLHGPDDVGRLHRAGKKMQADGLIPIAFAEKDGWPALGTFDILNLRINGYDYHIKLMKHQVPWTDPGVTAVFNQWRELMPYCRTAPTAGSGRTRPRRWRTSRPA